MAYNKIFFHAGPACSCTGVGDLFSELDEAVIPFGHKTADEYGTAWEASQYANATTVWRLTTKGQNDGRDYDVPDYSLPPADAALKHWLITKAKLPPEFNKNTWIEPINEVDKERADWLGYFALAIANMANSEGYKVSLFAFSAGEPEADDWETPGMIAYLEYCADHPNEAAVSLHEYSLTKADLFEAFPYLIGRFQFLHDVCDDYGIARPTIFVSEFGWEYQNVPDVSQAMAEIAQAAELYAAYPNIKFAAVWYLGGGSNWPNIGQQTQRLIEPIKRYALAARFPDPVEPPEEPEPEEPPMTTIQIGNNHGGYLTHLGAGEKTLRLTPGYFDGRTFVPTGEPTAIILPDDAKALHYVSLSTKDVECPDEPVNPNPPPVVLTLPRGSKGVDVSYWQGSFNWEVYDAQFGIIRCSDGMTSNTTTHDGNGIDRQFWANAGKLTAVGIPWAIYHFLRPGSIQAQADKVLGAIEKLYADGTPPVTAVFDNGVKFPAVWIDVEDSALTSAHVQEFYSLLAAKHHTGIYTGKPVWDGIMAGTPQWWSTVPLWIAAYGINDGNVPNWPDGPFLPLGWNTAVLWQYSSNPIDQNIVGPYPPTATQPPPPTGATYSTSFMKAVPNAWRVIRRFDGSGEDVFDLPLGGNRFVRVKNFNEGEWYNGNMRERDTSPAPQTDGTERLCLLNGGAGGQIAPDTAVVGVTYSFTNYVQFKAKQGCANLSENSGTAVSTFLLKEVIDNYTFPSTGFTVDRLFWTVQTGENQLYAIKDGVNIGWVGGGAQQQNNVWGGELAELYFDRSIPQREPPRYCE